jgi:cytidyltransferase-like protein
MSFVSKMPKNATCMMFGTFDVLHFGHVAHIEWALSQCVGGMCIVLARDTTVLKIKGHPPAFPEAERLVNMAALFPECRIILGSASDPMHFVRELQPEQVFLGYDQVHFVDTLEGVLHTGAHIIRGTAFSPELFKSSKIATSLNLIRGEVVHGLKKGRSLGYPTANIQLSSAALQTEGIRNLSGIFASRVLLDGSLYLGATIVGVRCESGTPLVETHILDFTGDVYGKTITVSLEKKLRECKKYTNDADLVVDIQKDLTDVRMFFNRVV